MSSGLSKYVASEYWVHQQMRIRIVARQVSQPDHYILPCWCFDFLNLCVDPVHPQKTLSIGCRWIRERVQGFTTRSLHTARCFKTGHFSVHLTGLLKYPLSSLRAMVPIESRSVSRVSLHTICYTRASKGKLDLICVHVYSLQAHYIVVGKSS